MHEQVIIDGNNLWHAMREHAPVPAVGRETLVKIVDRWAGQAGADVMIVFDGPTPREGLAKQMATRRVNVRFSAPQSADDVIEKLLRGIRDPASVRVITSDTAVRNDATHRRCRHTDSVRFVSEMFPSDSSIQRNPRGNKGAKAPNAPTKRSDEDTSKNGNASRSSEKPRFPVSQETSEWLDWFGADGFELPDEWNELGR